jgi:hypothetical protein
MTYLSQPWLGTVGFGTAAGASECLRRLATSRAYRGPSTVLGMVAAVAASDGRETF